ncbi:hypothetical protein J4Q44_G00247640 [Coregonus suidteri]|uniref:Uncharacterized protein n=1 Tax=Coregonus suidteri TaxID=861788 RepID=A0AAN8L7T4_9TELE
MSEISSEEAAHRLKVTSYPFKKINLNSRPILLRFWADSSGDSAGKFARPGPSQPELRQHLVPGQRVAVHHINANYFLDETSVKPEEEADTFSFSGGFEDPATAMYINFLKEGLEKAKEYQAQ